MVFLSILPPYDAWIQALIDALLLILFLTPPLYFFMYRPMSRHVNQLIDSHNQLQSEIVERKVVEEVLRRSEKQLKYLYSHLLSGQEEERKSLSRELHEELAQDLAVLRLGFQHIKEHLKEDQTTIRSECEENLRLVSQVINKVTHLSESLTPLALEFFGLNKGLEELINDLARKSGITTSFRGVNLEHFFPPQVQIAIYRIVKEVVTNIEEHAKATSMSLIIGRQNGNVSFMVEDNGSGFDTKEVLAKGILEKGLGLVTMEERIRMLDGTLTVWSQQGQGTRISFTIPEKPG
jgi:signal transduction histidine kinase